MRVDPWSPEYFEKRAWERFKNAKLETFEPWEEARERYIQEKIEPDLQRYRERDQDWFSDFWRRRGECMHSSDLIYRLQNLNPHIQVQQQVNFDDEWGLYTTAVGKLQFLTGLPKGWMTEFSYAILDAHNLPKEERRGWRTVLVYCLLKGALTWGQVLDDFGEPQDGFNEVRWQETVRDMRLGGEQMFQRNIANAIQS